MRKDRSARTKVVGHWNVAFLVACAMLVIGLCGLAWGCSTYQGLRTRSSSPVGTTMTFGRSQATVSIAGIYTDEARSVLIVRLAPDSSTAMNLPYKGTDYRVFVNSAAYSGMEGKSVPMVFGRYSTNGDYFLIIPRPTDAIYNVFVQNRNYIATDRLAQGLTAPGSSSTSGTTAAINGISQSASDSDQDEVEAQLADALNAYRYDTSGDGAPKSITIPSAALDAIGFRVTLNPAIDSAEYEPDVIPGQLLSDDGKFDYEAFFNAVFKSAATATAESDYDSAQTQKSLLEQRVTELDGRIKENPADTEAKELRDRLTQQIDSLDNTLDLLSEQYGTLESVQYSPKLFSDMQSSAYVFTAEQMDQVARNQESR